MDEEFGNDCLGLFGNTFRLGLASCGSRFIIYYFICFIYLFIYIVLFLIFLTSIRSEFLLRNVPIHILVFGNLFIYLLTYLFGGAVGEFIFGTVACWWHAIGSTIKYSVPLQDCFLWGSVFPVKAMVSRCFCLKWTSPWTLDTFLALFITHLCCSN